MDDQEVSDFFTGINDPTDQHVPDDPNPVGTLTEFLNHDVLGQQEINRMANTEEHVFRRRLNDVGDQGANNVNNALRTFFQERNLPAPVIEAVVNTVSLGTSNSDRPDSAVNKYCTLQHLTEAAMNLKTAADGHVQVQMTAGSAVNPVWQQGNTGFTPWVQLTQSRENKWLNCVAKQPIWSRNRDTQQAFPVSDDQGW